MGGVRGGSDPWVPGVDTGGGGGGGVVRGVQTPPLNCS